MPRNRRFAIAAMLLSAIMLPLAACGPAQNTAQQATQGDRKTQSRAANPENPENPATPEAKTAQDPTTGEWTEVFSDMADLDGELDEAWLDCAPQNNPNPESFAWKRTTDHDGVWLHTDPKLTLGSTQLSCMRDELDIHASGAPSADWTMTTFGNWDQYQRKTSDSYDVVWKYSAKVRESLTVKAKLYQVTLPYSWLGEFTATVDGDGDGDEVRVVSREHPDYELCRFTLVNPNIPVNAGDIGNSLITSADVTAGSVQMWAKRWPFIAATSPQSVDSDAAEDVTELQTGDSLDYDTLIPQITAGDTSNLFRIDDYLKSHISISKRG